MKKVLSVVLSLAILCSFLVLPASASEIQPHLAQLSGENFNAKAYVTAKAIEAFPEYADKIQGNQLPDAMAIQPYSASANTIAVNETRFLSEDIAVNYVEYANGLALISLFASAGKNVTNTSSNGSYTDYTFNAWLTITGSSDTLMIVGLRFRVYSNGNTSVQSKGSVGASTTAIAASLCDYNTVGTPGDPAYVEYMASFYVNFAEMADVLQPAYLHIDALSSGPSVYGYII